MVGLANGFVVGARAGLAVGTREGLVEGWFVEGLAVGWLGATIITNHTK